HVHFELDGERTVSRARPSRGGAARQDDGGGDRPDHRRNGAGSWFARRCVGRTLHRSGPSRRARAPFRGPALVVTARPVITLLTDFGTQDPYVGMMKGVIARICPDANVIDITHEVPPQDVRIGAFFLERARSYFPKGTVHL